MIMGGNFIRLSFTGQSQSLRQWYLISSQTYIEYIIYDGNKNEIFHRESVFGYGCNFIIETVQRIPLLGGVGFVVE